MIAYCLFEQSGTFKNEFKKLGIDAYDYDIENAYGETDYQIDLFNEIECAYRGESTLFDKITQEDIVMAFFPCTRFESKIPLSFRGELYQMKNYTEEQKLRYAMKLHDELNRNYRLISELVLIAKKRKIRMIIENPYSQPHYLTKFWCIKPSIIDMNRRKNGDYMKKPTQYFFINCTPKDNLVFEPVEYVEYRRIDYINDKNRAERRSEIHPQYASRFIRQYIL